MHLTAHFDPYVGGVEHVVESLARGPGDPGQATRTAVITSDVGARGHAREEVRRSYHLRRHRAVVLGGTPISPGMVLDLLRQNAGTVVHVHGPHAFLPELARCVSALRGHLVIVHMHLDVEASSALGILLRPYKRWLLGPSLRRADRVIALTAEMRRQIIDSYKVEPSRIVVIGNGVDDEFFGVRHRPHDGPSLRVLCVGRLVRQKNVARLLRALALVTVPIDAVVVGDGDERTRLLTLADELALDDVRFVGEQDHDSVREWLGWTDVVVSASDREGMPLALLEAMAAGVPVVATDVEGTRELIDGVGVLTAPSPEGLAHGIESLAVDARTRADLAERARRSVEGRRWSVVCRLVEREYEAL